MIIAKNIHKYYDNLHVLKGVDIHIKKGETVAFVGPSGAGKTTLVKLLVGLYPPKLGQVLYNSINYNEVNLLVIKKICKFMSSGGANSGSLLNVLD